MAKRTTKYKFPTFAKPWTLATTKTSMLKTLLFLLILSILGCSQGQIVLRQDYSFLVTDGEVTKLRQSNDTLYELKCYIDRPCHPRPSSHYKILSSNNTGELIILKLEQLDTIPLTTDPYPATRYQVLALKISDEKELGYLPLTLGLTRQQLDTIKTNIPALNDKFFFTFYSDTYLKELSKLKNVTTKSEVNEIIEVANSDSFKTLIEKYSKTETRDMYASGLSAELINRACIEKGYNPIGAGRAINVLMRQ
ncbi:MAG TPA: hypothetical protein VGE25_08905 [Sediminibacterium sp.]